IFDFFDDSAKAFVQFYPYVYPGDLNDIWNIKWFCCDFGHDNWFDLERDGTPVCGSENCPGPPGSCWCEPVTKRNGNYPGISWSVGLSGELTLTHDRDYQVYGDTYLYVEVAKTLVVPILSDVGRVWLNDVVISSGTLELTAGLNHLEWTSYNQNQSTIFSLDFPFTCNVDWMGSAPPECGDSTDNDGDGLIDYPDDLGCTSRIDVSELTGDFNDDRRVDFEDLGIMAQYWLQDEPLVDIAPLPTGDDIANMQDFAIFAGNWLKGI
ncbi:MAG: hypothetical protein MUP16_12835, partial [Sedimentisphaerales bacterium]|nr:hypothetical protein [Sedimentisphaerales bacterium]